MRIVARDVSTLGQRLALNFAHFESSREEIRLMLLHQLSMGKYVRFFIAGTWTDYILIETLNDRHFGVSRTMWIERCLSCHLSDSAHDRCSHYIFHSQTIAAALTNQPLVCWLR